MNECDRCCVNIELSSSLHGRRSPRLVVILSLSCCHGLVLQIHKRGRAIMFLCVHLLVCIATSVASIFTLALLAFPTFASAFRRLSFLELFASHSLGFIDTLEQHQDCLLLSGILLVHMYTCITQEGTWQHIRWKMITAGSFCSSNASNRWYASTSY